MNSPVIVKVEFKYLDNDYSEFVNFDIVPFSASFSESISASKAGHIHKSTLSFKKESVSTENEAVFYKLRNRPAQFRVTDANNYVFVVGNSDYKARLTYKKSVSGSNSGFNGYECTVSCSSPYSCIS